LFVVSDFGVSSGYGRIAAEVFMRLQRRGYEIAAAGLPYDGLLPPQYDGQPLPFWVAALGGKPNWPEIVANLVNLHQPDVVIVLQDFPYAEQVHFLPLDWSRYGFVVITPVDGAPIYPRWLDVAGKADGLLTISEFGVQTFKKAGLQAKLCRPGVDATKFHPLTLTRRAEIRAKLGIEPGAFVLGIMAMNQNRKGLPQMMKAFFDFAQDKPSARLLLDMEKVGGWDLPALIEQQGWNVRHGSDVAQVIYREEALRAGVTELSERYGILDAHAVLAFREGYGLPIAEAMACGVVSMAQDYCAGTEILKEGRGILIPSVDYFYPSSWGGAEDRLPDYRVMAEKLQWLYDQPLERAAMAERGRTWAVTQTWDAAADAVQEVVERVLAGRPLPQPVPLA
jgi:glycosyltransferase involved in cell wall biosynthesis